MSHDREWVDIEEIQKTAEQPKATPVVIDRAALLSVLDVLENGHRIGEAVDQPEGSRYIQISDTLAQRLAAELRDSAKEATHAD